ncbi:serine/threonine-protein kinase STY13 [Zea mays]|uniref:Protein kinase superfamily protein n=2 Tax=Zea mays TaxID=4577 RepID=A0A1D6GHU4_MAIZE|nr:serine/threonine-protein kinase STY13 [Zea mays]AQK63028.1 Protein kinase superfamily protein [Zea mays]AQK63029.1 Protein kinase superfamily protein [Zea mays]|eukprot:XP_008646500.3 serine/threonine-protein kinase HT1 [Zea mays]
MSHAGASIGGGGGAARGRSRSLGSSSRAGNGNGAGAFVRAGADGNEMYVRADKIDLKTLDVQLEKTRSQVWLDHQRSAASPRPETPLLGWEIDLLGKLDIQNQIAHGTFGVVYRGTYDGHDVAVKVLDWGHDGQDTAAKHREAFEKEVAVWQKLDHPNVTKFVGASMGTSQLKIPRKQGSTSTSSSSSSCGGRTAPNECCVVVVEFQHGGTLKTLLYNHRDKKLSYRKVVRLALDLARGLNYLHSKKIMHRDVKAENMLLDRKRTLKIADFGVARVEAQSCEVTGQTGTLGYMAPEVLQGKPYDHKCDVYSFGILLWETYCCAMAYPNYSLADISYHVVKLGIRPDIPRCCPRPMADIMTRCWDGNPDNRPEMSEVVALLEKIDTGSGKGGMTPVDDVSQGCTCFGFNRSVA